MVDGVLKDVENVAEHIEEAAELAVKRLRENPTHGRKGFLASVLTILISIFGLGVLDVYQGGDGDLAPVKSQLTEIQGTVVEVKEVVSDHVALPRHPGQADTNEIVVERLNDLMDQLNHIDLARQVQAMENQVERIRLELKEDASRIDSLSVEMIRVSENGNLTNTLKSVYESQIARLNSRIQENNLLLESKLTQLNESRRGL